MTLNVVVVGSGMSGGIAARVLALSRYRVTILEKGSNFFAGLGASGVKNSASGVTNTFSNDEVGWESRTAPINQDPVLEPRTFRTDTGSGKRTFVGDVQFLPTTVGGGTVHFDAKFRRFREVDFTTNSLMGGTDSKPAIPGTTYVDWPVNYKQMEPFYAVSEEILGVQGPAHRNRAGRVVNPNPYESWRSTPFPMPPGVDMLSSLLPAEAAALFGYTGAAVPTAVNSRPYRGRPACVDCGFCLNYGCPINAKSSGAWPISDAIAAGATLVPNANVVNIHYSKGSPSHVQSVDYIDADGNPHNQPADILILANTPIEATRLSILSGILDSTTTEPTGLLGRNLMFHLQTTAIAILNRDIHSWRGRTSTQTLDAFCGSGPGPEGFDPAVPRGGIVEIGGNINPVTAANEVAAFMFGAAHKQYMELGPFTKRITAFTMQGEDMPQLSNCVDLDPDVVDVFGLPVPRITYKSHPYELAAAAYYAPKLVAILEAIGEGAYAAAHDIRTVATAVINTTLPPVTPGQVDRYSTQVTSATPFNEIPASRHIMGTHRIALTQENGPCDPFGRYWAFDNLYHAGGGQFCTAPGFNVTLTMAALSYRTAAAIVAGVPQQSKYSSDDVSDAQAALIGVLKRCDSDTMIARVANI
jgi:choline dehydrogenase-like flavoprotein